MIGKICRLLKHRREVRMALSSALRIAEGDENASILGGLTAKAIAAAKPGLRIIAVDNFSWNPFGLPADLHEAFTRRILANEIKTRLIERRSGNADSFPMPSSSMRSISMSRSGTRSAGRNGSASA